ncbi:MAG TPA: LysR family transcriptional regulator [Burkholderiaceae bacterium]|nr:LysR family transcriptional regulator [Burkholderiaceae bacterium]
MDRITSMRVFVRAAQAGSLSAAARQLGMSPAMATKHVNRLEAYLGISLFHRSTRRLVLSETGSHYLEACQRILADIDEADAAASTQTIKASGLLRMSVPLSFGSRYIAPLMADFSRLHPEVKTELGLSDAMVDLVGSNWDMAIRIGRLADSALHARRLGGCTMHVCAAPAYLDIRGLPRKVDELAHHNCLSYTLSAMQNPNKWHFGTRGEYSVAVDGNLVANNGDALLAAALAGQGIIYQPHFIVGPAIERGELVELKLDRPPVPLDGIYVLYPPGRRQPAKVRAMIDYLAEKFAQTPP